MNSHLLLEREEWAKRIAELPEEADMPALRKGLSAAISRSTKAINADTRTVESVISTAAIDRDNDIINPKRWDLKAYKKNPVVLWGHDHHSPPIATSVVRVVDEKLRSTDTFPEEGIHPLADLVFNLVRGGFVRAKSVGFRPQRGKFAFDEEQGGYRFDGQELLEHSYVSVPSNPEALVGAKSAGIDLSPMVEWAQSVLDAEHGPGLLWLPRETVERALKIAEHQRTVIPIGTGLKLIAAASAEEAAHALVEVPLPTKAMGVEEMEERLEGLGAEVAKLIGARLEKEDEEAEAIAEDLMEEEDDADETMMEEESELSTDSPETIEDASVDPVAAMLTSLLDGDALPSSEAPRQTGFSEAEVEFLGQALGAQVQESVRDAVRGRLTALTGRLD